ncbi:hypothetical protein SNE40_006046 [Patella caerulea]|uniref:PHD-type domain-containing protein n=1 Tax=Patella caerulea TaxID=87958 RepID=A0AAN8K2H8_PATCE
MAAGLAGVLTAVFMYSLCCTFIPTIINSCSSKYPEISSVNRSIVVVIPFSPSHEIIYNIVCAQYPDSSSNTTFTTHMSTSKIFFTLSLLICGDIHPCPGPVRTTTPKYPCILCGRGIRINSKAISCDCCLQWIHVKCSDFSLKNYNILVKSGSDFEYTCAKCSLQSLPCDISDNDEISTLNYNSSPNNSTEEKPSVFKCFQTKGIHMIHINARSLLSKIDELRLLVLDTNASILAVTETMLDSTVSDTEIAIDNFLVIRKDRNRDGGGVAIYIKVIIAFNPRTDLQSDSLETIRAELLLPKTKPILIGCCYRPPTQNNFYDILEQTCMKNSRFSNLETYILGDFNTDLSRNTSVKNCLLRGFRNFCFMFNLSQ